MRLIFALLALAFLLPAHAQQSVKICVAGTGSNCVPVSNGAPLPVSASASITGFRPTAYGTPISATTGGATGTLPAGAEVVATNVGSFGAFCKLGASVDTTGQYLSPGGAWFAFAISGDTQLTCQGVGGTTTINMAGGSGLPTGTGGGGGSSGGGTSETDQAAFTYGTTAYTPMGGVYNSSITNLTSGQGGAVALTAARSMHVLDDNSAAVLAAVTGAIPAGTNIIGKVGIDQTTPGTTNGVQTLAGSTTSISAGPANVSPTDCSSTITTGGTAQNAFAAQTTLHGFTIVNIDTTEPLWISFTTTAAASGSGSYPLQASTATTFASAGSFTTPFGFGLNHALSVIAATTGHKFTCTWW